MWKVQKSLNRRKLSWRQRAVERLELVAGFLRHAVPWVLLLGVLVAVPALLYQGWGWFLSSSIFQIQDVSVEGCQNADAEVILEAAGYRGPTTNVFSIDPNDAAKAIVEAEPWVVSARVDRSPINRSLRVVVEERSVHGIVLLGELMLVDEDGRPFKSLEGEQGLDMPVITGLGDSAEALVSEDRRRIQEAMAITQLYEEVGVSEIERLAEVDVDVVAGFTLVTESEGVRVILGDGHIRRRLERLKEVFRELRRQKIKVSSIRLDGDRSLRYVALTVVEQPGEGASRP